MKNFAPALIFVIAFSNVFGQVIFDPALTDELHLPAGLPNNMQIVDIDGEKFLKVALSNWETVLQVTSTICKPSNMFYAKTILKHGNQNNTGDNIVEIRLAQSSWQQNNLFICGSTSYKPIQSPQNQFGNIYYNDIAINTLQFVNRNTNTWQAIPGDTLFIGKIEAYQMNDSVIFDPSTVDLTTLPKGMQIVEADGKKYLKVITGKSISVLPIKRFNTRHKNNVKTKIKYSQGSSGCSVSNAHVVTNLFISPNKLTEHFSDVINSVDKFTDIDSLYFMITALKKRNGIENAEIYIDKIIAYESYNPGGYYMPYAIKTVDINYCTGQIVTDAVPEDVYGQLQPVNNVAYGIVDSIYAGPGVTVKPNSDSYASWSAVWDEHVVNIFVDVTDSDVVELYQNTTGIRPVDAVELFIDHLPNYGALIGNSGVRKFTFCAGQASPATGGNGMPLFYGDNDNTNINFVYKKTSKGYVFEIAIPIVGFYRTPENTVADAIEEYNYREEIVKGYKTDFSRLGIGFNVVNIDKNYQVKSVLCWANNTGFDIIEQLSPDYRGRCEMVGRTFTSVTSKLNSNGFNIYPNPAQNQITINTNNTEIMFVTIYDLTGKVMLKNAYTGKNNATINIDSFLPGVYVVKINCKNGALYTNKINVAR